MAVRSTATQPCVYFPRLLPGGSEQWMKMAVPLPITTSFGGAL